MRKRGLGLLLILTFLVVAVAAFQTFRFDLSIGRERAAALNIERTIGTIEVALANLRAAQAAYVAAGQNPDVWMSREADLAAEVDGRLTALQSATISENARSHYEAAAVALATLSRLDRKARTEVTSGEKLTASDAIFMDSLEPGRRLDQELQQARDVESAASGARINVLRQAQLAVAGGVVIVTLVVAVVFYRSAVKTAGVSASVVAPGSRPSVEPHIDEDLPLTSRLEAPAIIQAPVIPPPRPMVHLTEAAEVCVDLARVLDARDVPPLFARAAEALEANGLIVWVANSGRTTLHPSLAHGYPQRVLDRMGQLSVDADNATALAFRSMRAQVISSQTPGAHGAIVVPLITASGCVGVLAAEVRQGTPGDDTLSVARMLAAQMATLVAPIADSPAQAAQA